ncbi:hypothetical protein [Micromonospora mirobrigensis]|uniref:Phage tail tape measure protein, TP901 family, core region n=1 Tax=Micromonospora mirobrigensis TaxID=262898 RepID=A0A1C4YQG0_9ACTN|nr:hypothetical protein [Micromonospora mirobrigensis]SCF22571.1 hypothetical protein GA0070564_104259 [Micromonospora mirobrigensis]
MANAVTLTFAGEDKPLVDSFGRVGGAARDMERDLDRAGGGFDRVGEAADTVDTRAMGFRDTMTGVQDSAAGVSELMKGNLFEGTMLVATGVGDLGSAFYNFLMPQLKSAVSWLGKTRLGTLAVAGAQRVQAAAQWLMNSAMWASPITWIIVGIIALVAVIVLIATKTDWFQRAWRASWSWIKSAASNTWEFIKKIPGWIGNVFSRIADAIGGPFRAAFNFVAEAWNSTVGRLSWSVPSWIPGIGGNSISVPNLPYFHAGGRVPGAPGQNVLAMLQAGETVSSAAGRGGGGSVRLESDGTPVADFLIEILRSGIKHRGGDVQLVLGR